MRPRLERFDLGRLGHAPKYNGRPDVCALAELLGNLPDLGRELPRGGQDELAGARGGVQLLLDHPAEGRQEEGQRLATASFGAADQVVPAHRQGPALGLDGRGRREPRVPQRGLHPLGERRRAEGLHGIGQLRPGRRAGDLHPGAVGDRVELLHDGLRLGLGSRWRRLLRRGVLDSPLLGPPRRGLALGAGGLGGRLDRRVDLVRAPLATFPAPLVLGGALLGCHAAAQVLLPRRPLLQGPHRGGGGRRPEMGSAARARARQSPKNTA
mmetsp:Transcript_23781/g.67829  ORF Transcript_23781/g.67829 Transcript_23781/m.67829 type:complete len:268 (-) Transcript_23781:8-811(-)